jgi:hypothetical protein
VRDPRHPLEQTRQFPARAPRSIFFERVSAREHQGDDDADQKLAERKCGCNRDQCDRVDTDVSARE